MKILLSGANGFLGSAIMRLSPCTKLIRASSTSEGIPIYSGDIEKLIRGSNATAIIHCAALSSAANCQADPTQAQAGNVELTRTLAKLADQLNLHFVYISTDLVFDGNLTPPEGFTEGEIPEPRSVYSCTKRAAEELVLHNRSYSILRISLLYGPATGDSRGVLGWMLDSFSAGHPINAFHDEVRTPLFVEDAAKVALLVADRRLQGIFHVSGRERVNRVEFSEMVAVAYGYPKQLIQSVSRLTMGQDPPRSPDLSLNSNKLWKAVGFEPVSLKRGLYESAHFTR